MTTHKRPFKKDEFLSFKKGDVIKGGNDTVWVATSNAEDGPIPRVSLKGPEGEKYFYFFVGKIVNEEFSEVFDLN